MQMKDIFKLFKNFWFVVRNFYFSTVLIIKVCVKVWNKHGIPKISHEEQHAELWFIIINNN